MDIINTNAMHHGTPVFTGEAKIEGIAGEHEDNGALQDSQTILLEDVIQEAEEITCWKYSIFAIAIKPFIRQVIGCKGPHLVA